MMGNTIGGDDGEFKGWEQGNSNILFCRVVLCWWYHRCCSPQVEFLMLAAIAVSNSHDVWWEVSCSGSWRKIIGIYYHLSLGWAKGCWWRSDENRMLNQIWRGSPDGNGEAGQGDNKHVSRSGKDKRQSILKWQKQVVLKVWGDGDTLRQIKKFLVIVQLESATR